MNEELTDSSHQMEVLLEQKNTKLQDVNYKQNVVKINDAKRKELEDKETIYYESRQKKIHRIMKSHPFRNKNKYTICGSEELEMRISGHMALIKKYIISRIDAKNKLSLVLGGSYGRGEGGIVRIGLYERPFNDYDFFVFVDNISYIGRKILQRKFRHAAKVLSKELGIVIDFSPPYVKQLLAGLPPAMRWYDLKFGHRIIMGNPNVLRGIPINTGKSLPIQEAIQLMLNRGVGLLQAKFFLQRKDLNSLKILMLINKCFLALGDAFLMAKGTYHYNLEVRKEILYLYSKQIKLAHEIYPFYCESINFKTYPTIEIDRRKLEQLYIRAEIIFKIMYLQLFALYYDKPIQNYKGFAAQIRDNPVVDYRGSNRLKNILFNVSLFGLASLKTRWGVAYPANRLYAVLPFFLFNDVNSFYSVKEINEVLCWNKWEKGNKKKAVVLKKQYHRFLNIWSRFN